MRNVYFKLLKIKQLHRNQAWVILLLTCFFLLWPVKMSSVKKSCCSCDSLVRLNWTDCLWTSYSISEVFFEPVRCIKQADILAHQTQVQSWHDEWVNSIHVCQFHGRGASAGLPGHVNGAQPSLVLLITHCDCGSGHTAGRLLIAALVDQFLVPPVHMSNGTWALLREKWQSAFSAQ